MTIYSIYNNLNRLNIGYWIEEKNRDNEYDKLQITASQGYKKFEIETRDLDYSAHKMNNNKLNAVIKVLQQQVNDSINMTPDEMKGAHWALNRVSKLTERGLVQFDAVVRQEIADIKEYVKNIIYNTEAEGCGLEDRGIFDRYEAMAHGWEMAMGRVLEAFPE